VGKVRGGEKNRSEDSGQREELYILKVWGNIPCDIKILITGWGDGIGVPGKTAGGV